MCIRLDFRDRHSAISHRDDPGVKLTPKRGAKFTLAIRRRSLGLWSLWRLHREIRPLVARCQLGLGKLHRRTGKQQQAHEHLATAATMFREMGLTYWLENAEADYKML